MEVTQIQGEALSKMYDCADGSLLLKKQWEEVQGPGLVFFKVGTSSGVVAWFGAYSFLKMGKSFLITPPGFPYCGFHFVDLPADSQLKKPLLDQVSIAIAEFLKKSFPRTYIDISLPPAFNETDAFSKSGFKVMPRQTYLLDLSKTEESLVKGLSGNRKRNVKSLAKGYQVNVNSPENEVLSLVEFTMHKSGDDSMRPVYQRLIDKAHIAWVKHLFVSKDGKPISGGIFIYDSEECFYFAGGYDPAIQDHNAGTLCLWSAMMEAKEKGLKVFNFCGSSIPSIERYFKSFGPVRTPYLRIKKGTKVIDTVMKVKGKLFN